MRVLIAEDDALTRRILQRAVENLGHEALIAADGLAAWDIYNGQGYIDVIISDRVMPGMDGIELCRKVRKSGGDNYTFFIFITALGARGDLVEGMEAGADDYLAKPLDQEQLQARLLVASRVTSLHHRLEEQNLRLEELNRQLYATARRDTLTKLGNRLKLREDLEQISSRIDRYDYRCCVVLCDIDYFKSYNDAYGHLAGDEVLERISQTFLTSLRRGDSAYRYGGEEFLITLPEQTLRSASRVAERLRSRVEDLALPHGAREEPKIITISVGLAEIRSNEGRPSEDLLRDADAALYEAKSQGRNRVMVHGVGIV